MDKSTIFSPPSESVYPESIEIEKQQLSIISVSG